ncbi:hypothetical protein GYMLUDRAFT_42397 [Collybiopsis luxurians FD-317 M1]|uniref:Smr domain-containing protein n=1 Tax=Collybiopsis luxurians FD-317 M1 TaxID=944289 RepID=A0A0D0BDZ6_9AGAR|nr:hypothetical protein GYMLUDRAFT_42397 [Collybiopsis luxurians FD-317 M1]
MNIQGQLFDSFQRQYPQLDSSLIAAILLDLEGREPLEADISAVHATLSELAIQADVLALAEDFSDVGVTDDSTPSLSFTNGETSTSNSADFSNQPFYTPLGFLQAALPHIAHQHLQRVILDAELEGGVLDMSDVVDRILSEESIREMTERGFDDLDGPGKFAEQEQPWETVGKKPRSMDSGRKKNKGRKITLVDVRQQQHAKPSPSVATQPSPSVAAPDPWTQISSLSSHLASLLSSKQPSYFSTYFHSPKYPTPYAALTDALHAIIENHASNDETDYTPTVISLLDVLLPSYDYLDPEQSSRLVADIELSLGATLGRADEALDLVRLLRELDDDASGCLEMGIYHQPVVTGSSPAVVPSPQSPAGDPANTQVKRSPPSGPPPVPPPPFVKIQTPSLRSKNKPSPYQWQAVPRRKPRKTPYAHAAYIPAYTRDVNGIKVRGSGNGFGKGGKGDVGELGEFRKRIEDSLRRRNEMLREASRMWQKGNAKSRGGEVALYFAERAREFQELAKKDALEAARTMVESKRMSSQGRDTIDLHGTTVSEAIVIVSETLASMRCTPSKPLKVITGRGTHSANQTSVLKPALQKALVEDGWAVSTWDGGLIVRGKRGQV